MDEARERIIEAAAELLAAQGRDALTTRAVAAAAGVQAPTIYRLFGDKSGLIDAVAEHGFTAYLAEKEVRAAGGDPVEDLRAGWDLHVGFGLANPALYALMYGDPLGGARQAAKAAEDVLRGHVRRIAAAGRLRVAEELAVVMIRAAGEGTVLTLLSTLGADPRLSEASREAVIAAITTGAPASAEESGSGPGPGPAAAVTLRAGLAEIVPLSAGERALLGELLDRLIFHES